MEKVKMKRFSLCTGRTLIFMTLMLLLPASSIAQNRTGTLKAPVSPTPISVKERSIKDLLYFPFTCVTAKMNTKDLAWQEVTNTFGTCESVNLSPGLHAGKAFDFTYRGVSIGICYYDWSSDRTWYEFFFKSKVEADKFCSIAAKDIQNAGIPLTRDKMYGGMSNRKNPVSVFKWVYVGAPEKVKEMSPSNIETADVVGMYKVEIGVYKRKSKQ